MCHGLAQAVFYCNTQGDWSPQHPDQATCQVRSVGRRSLNLLSGANNYDIGDNQNNSGLLLLLSEDNYSQDHIYHSRTYDSFYTTATTTDNYDKFTLIHNSQQ